MSETFKMIVDSVNYLGQEWDGLWRETRNDGRKLVKEISEDIRHEVENKASSINPEFGKFVKNTNETLGKVENIINTIIKNPFPGGSPCSGDYYVGDHLYVFGVGYTHHAIYVGNNLVIHYNFDDDDKISGIYIFKVTVQDFARGDTVYRLTTDESPLRFKKEEAVRRAHSRLYEQKYNLLYNNCDTFVRWCRYGNDM